jgi:signal transduction histidine kinase
VPRSTDISEINLEEHGDVHLRLTRSNGEIEVQVTDTGPGVPDKDRERIFERSIRLNPTAPGSGLGLAIARRIARQHNGELTCDRCPSGASFTLRLPAAT